MYYNVSEKTGQDISTHSYHNILKNSNQLLKELKMIEENKRFYSLCNIVNSGYLSINKQHVIKSLNDNTLEAKGKLLMCGFGTCRNTQSFLVDFLHDIDIYSYLIRGRLCDYKFSLMKKVNHVVTMSRVYDDNGNPRYILYDLINFYIFELLKDFHMYSYDNQKFVLPANSILYQHNYLNEMACNDLNKNLVPYYDKKQLVILQEEVFETLRANKNLLEDFYSANYSDIGVVASYVNKTLNLK